ncbi:uncharacterized protein B0H18DRAFT_976273 [Fomitopsis serialis]|uniref:uncharacterized protein n=1 Tax=Fomitopsis serialis TaxID=139415 RepID=UPI0020079948|nr:uncharacterized protein B0H18DRAFT_976273 [Neoantrodia serialis]KAH9935563.1 hypothetical protein B0H18DRAFT_976273 [Neoantrodia serialis]
MPVVSRPQRPEAIQAKYNVTVDFPHLGLHTAAATGNLGLVKYALDHGQPINSVLDGVLPLHAACSGGNDHVVRLLIEKGADVNAPRLPRRYTSDKNRDTSAPIVGTSGSTPLHFACANGHTPVVLTLLMHGAHPDRADKHGTTPEMLARQNGWTACAEVLHNWSLNKDRDLREKEELTPSQTGDASAIIDTKHVCGGHECRFCTSKRLRVKRSIDHALNMLKPSLSQLHSSTLGESAGTTLETIIASPLLPTDSFGESLLRSSSELAAASDSPERRPSLPDVFDPSQTMPMSRRSHGGTGTSSRRPRSAGNNAEQQTVGRRVKGKVSLLSMFKKGDTSIAPEGSPGHASSSYTPSIASASASPPPGTPRRSDVHASSSTSDAFVPSSRLSDHASYSDMTIQGRPRGRVFSEGEATRVPPLPTAVDLHRVLSDERSRTLSSPNVPDGQLPESSSGSLSGNRSPSVRPGILRPHNRSISQQSQPDSPRSGSVGPPSSRSLRFDSPTTATPARSSDDRRQSSHSPARSLKMARSVSSMRSIGAVEATRSPLRTAIDIAEPSYDVGATDEPHNVFDEDEEEYGEPIVTEDHITELDSRLNALQVIEGPKRNSLLSQGSLSPLPSPSRLTAANGFDCPFSINEPPPDDVDSPTRQTFLGVNGNENRMRGDSMSSMSTNGTSGYLPTPGVQQSQLPSPWITSSTSTPPEYPSMDHGGRRRIQRTPSSTYSNDTEPVHKPKGPPSALDIDIGSISSYAQAEALVQRAQQSILELQDIQVAYAPPSAGISAGHTPLSAKLAAYGESLAIERKFRQEEEKRSSSSTVRSRRPSELSTRSRQDTIESSPGAKSLDRKFSLEERPHNRTIRQSKVRRPHTAGSTASSDILATPPRPGRSIPSPRHFPASGSQHATRSSSDQRVGDIATSYPPPMSSFLTTETDMYAAGSRPRVPRSRTPDPSLDDPLDRGATTGVPLSRISTAPVQDAYLKPKRGLTDQERQVARATKLVKMGFSTADSFTATSVNRNQTANRHRFGGFKGFVQSLTGK